MTGMKLKWTLKQISLRMDCTINRALIVDFSGISNRRFSSRVGNRRSTEATLSSSIADFYAGKSVFITGGTGFLGKVCIERLLYNCSHIENIYMLIREKNNSSIAQRMEEFTYNPIFNRLRKERPEDLKKIIPIIGNVTAPKLGISSEDEQLLTDNISVVIHSAATVKLTEPLSVAMKTNFEGAKSTLELCRRMKKLRVFVHISTAYSNTDKNIIREKVYSPPATVSDVYKFLEQYGDNTTQIKKLINGQPNTYTFTKALAESYIDENHGDVPTIIIRPSMITSCIGEPEGWIDEWNGPAILLSFMGKGIMRVVPSYDKVICDLIPVDYVSNLVIVAAAKYERPIYNDVIVYNSCSSTLNPITLKNLSRYYVDSSVKNNFNLLPYPSVYFTRSKTMLTLISFLLEKTPASIGDMWRRIRGKRPIYNEILGNVNIWRRVGHFFMSNSWLWQTHHLQILETLLSPADRVKFPFNPTDIDWRKHVSKFCEGTACYIEAKKQRE